MIVIELISGPNTGKSTLAHSLFAKLKKIGYNVEFVSEYAKELLFQESTVIKYQMQVFSEQLWRLRTMEEKADIIVTDTSLLLGLIYSKEKNPHFESLMLWEHKQYKNLTYFLERGDLVYQPHGRFETEEQAKEVDEIIINMLNSNSVDYKSIKRKGAKKTIILDIENVLKPTIETLKSNIE